MPTPLVLLVFAALCGIFFCAIAGAAVWELIRFRRGDSALSPRHLRWRLLSAVTWLIVLGSFFIASVFLWPQSPADKIMIRRFAVVTSGGLLLMMFAFVLMAVDIFWTVQVGRRSVVNRSRASQDTLRREIDRTIHRNGGPNESS